MASKKERPAAPEVEPTLVPFTVFIDGQDRTIFAKDEDDLKRRLAKIKS
jgi:hypothetical protein